MSAFLSDEHRAVRMLDELRVPESIRGRYARVLNPECNESELVSIGLDMFGREQRLERGAAAQWRAMAATAGQEGIVLAAISGFRSYDYQRILIERKLAQGVPLEEIVRSSALPGFSEHHTGRAIDIGTADSPPLTEEFEHTPAFNWLTRCAPEFGFSLSFPRGNTRGIIYEPWHWFYGRI